MKKILIVLFALLCTACLAFGVASCIKINNENITQNGSGNSDPNGGGNNTDDGEGDNNGDKDSNTDDGEPKGDVQYTIMTQTIGGKDVNGVRIKVSRDGNTVKEATSSDGYVRFKIPADDYDVSYVLPEGFSVDPDFTVTNLTSAGGKVTTKFKSAVKDAPLTSSYKYAEGEIVHNFSATDADGTTAELKELLKTYKLVLLNLWYIKCDPCAQEFPAIQRAYEKYQDKVYIISLSTHILPPDEDTLEDIKDYKQKHSCTFFMGRSSDIINNSFLISNPTNVFIDRYGTVDLIDSGTQTADSFWEGKFSYYVSDNYGKAKTAATGDLGVKIASVDTKIDFSEVLPEKFV